MKTRFMKCKNCDTVHVIVPNVKDRNPTCASCGGTSFIEVDDNYRRGPFPTYCNQSLDKEVWDASMSVVLGPIFRWTDKINEKYDIEIDKNDVQDLGVKMATIVKLALNWTRFGFIKDKFIKVTKARFKEYFTGPFKLLEKPTQKNDKRNSQQKTRRKETD